MMLNFHPVLLVVLFLLALYESLVIPNLEYSKIYEEENDNGRRCLLDPAQKKQREEDCSVKLKVFPNTFRHEDKEQREKTISWIKECIVDYYCFKKHPSQDEWIAQPSFKGLFDEPHFQTAATFSEYFFKIYNNWKDTIKKWEDVDKMASLLYITAARYVYVIFTLYQESRPQNEKGIYERDEKGRLAPCEVKMKKSGQIDYYVIPEYSCYPAPYGSASATSDYDVGLVGPKSGELVANFNDKFDEIFGRTSEEVFDTNIYAYSLEYAMPTIFQGLSKDFLEELDEMEASVKYQAQDLVFALLKIKKYQTYHYKQLYDNLIKGLSNEEAKKEVQLWNDMVIDYEKKTASIDPDTLTRQKSNKIFQQLMKSISDVTEGDKFISEYMTQLMLGHLYAAEAYHSRGAVRYVVGAMQMKDENIKSKLTLLDLWCTMLENWGDAMKEYKHANTGKETAEKKIIKMSKYLWRTWKSMTEISEKMTKGTKITDVSELATLSKVFNDIKKQITTKQAPLMEFFAAAKCDPAEAKEQVLSDKCIEKMFQFIGEYHNALMNVVFKPIKITGLL